MMTAKDLMRAGRLSEARRLLIEEVKSAPTDAGKRTLLFQVLAWGGEWDKAERHLDLISTQDPGRTVGVHDYLDIVRAEKERLKVMALQQQPSFLPEPPAYFTLYMEYLASLQAGSHETAKELIGRIDGLRPQVSGTLNGKPFEGFSDSDARLVAFLEAFVHERYVWIPFESIRELVVYEPKTSFDLIWVTASVTTWAGLSMNCSLPVVYPGSFDHDDEQAKMGRITDWVALGGGFSRAVGQHVFQAGDEDISILDIREVTFRLEGGQP
ncbi:MAG TPA: type VI secretion system accessory protein TagJ [Deltaproteobacteria bacterium]|nr:type VI secretion system accessory protein TagJ [Deltaproteobacteria bacterium]HPR54443.1 type VI secretion system accessory protein TagJ [Deltaproteobacteria bacterium]HXK46228.1 type VI secretion system accessory protein TagJ [Deltaproteobacteria bacterium]